MVEKDVEFVLEKELARGAFGVVYLGVLKSNSSRIVIKKLLHDDTYSQEELEQDGALFRKEIAFHSQLLHPNIVQFMCADFNSPDPTMLYLGLEWMPRGDLADFLIQRRGKPVPLPMLTYFCESVTKAVNYLHQKSLLHRDIKLENVFMKEINGSFCLKLGDFGFMVACDNNHVVYDPKLQGTPNYTAPEIWNNRHYSRQSDVFALGVFFYVLAISLYPFDSENTEEIKSAICNTKAAIPDSVSPDVSDLIKKCLASKSSDRPLAADILNHRLFKPENNALVRSQKLSKVQDKNEKTPLIEKKISMHSFHNAKPSNCVIQDIKQDKYKCCCVVS